MYNANDGLQMYSFPHKDNLHFNKLNDSVTDNIREKCCVLRRQMKQSIILNIIGSNNMIYK